ncbi:MAG: tetratricopeptide repeat protein, partial [Planctomycetota bacterium]
HRPDAPWSFESILRKCLAPNADDRYQEAEHLAEDLRRFLDDEPLQYAPELSRIERLAKWRRRHPRLTYAGTVALVAGLLLSVTGGALAMVKQHLDGTQVELAIEQGKQRKRDFKAGTMQALCLVNTTVGPQNHLSQGTKVCEETLELYDALSGETWREPADWRRMPPDESRMLAEDTRELLMLLAAARVRRAPADPSVLREALALLDRAETIHGSGRELKSSRALWLDRARYFDALDEPVNAKNARRRADDIPVASAREHYQLATVFARAGGPQDHRRAIAELDKALLLDSRHYWSWLQRGICYTELGELVMAAGDFGRCTGLLPEFAWGHFNLGYVQAQSGKLPEAVVSYTRSVECDPTLVAARVNLGLACLELKRYSAALIELDRALLQDDVNASLHAGRGIALEALMRHVEADVAFERAFALADAMPAAPRSQIRWAYGFAVASRLPADALRAFDEVLCDDPQNAQAFYGLAMLAMAKGAAVSALDFFDRAIVASPQFVEAHRYRAVQRARSGALAGAGEDINWCLAREPSSGASLYAAACVASLASQQRSDPKLASQAQDFLERAFAQGVGIDKADNDPDLAGARAHDAIWQNILRAKDDSVARQSKIELNPSSN